VSLWELTAAELLARTASAEPTPGGGSVSAIAGALGLGLVTMALAVTARRADAVPEVGALLLRSRDLLAALKTHPDADVLAFEGYMAALALPKANADAKEKRRKAIQSAALAATEAPLAAARDLYSALELAETAATLAHHSIVSDVGAGAQLICAALQATLLNVDINLGSLPALQQEVAQAARRQLGKDGQLAAERVGRLVADRLAR
jgi:methenyltetrahydrofolate cyclohydrolase